MSGWLIGRPAVKAVGKSLSVTGVYRVAFTSLGTCRRGREQNPVPSAFYVGRQAVLGLPIFEIRVDTVSTWGEERYPGD
jgi:hypothetical protein